MRAIAADSLPRTFTADDYLGPGVDVAPVAVTLAVGGRSLARDLT